MNGRALSAHQRNLLLWLVHKAKKGGDPNMRPYLGWVAWRGRMRGTKTQLTAASRCLRRLEERGLVLRHARLGDGEKCNYHFRKDKDWPGPREASFATTHVEVLPAGFALVEKLSTSTLKMNVDHLLEGGQRA